MSQISTEIPPGISDHCHPVFIKSVSLLNKSNGTSLITNEH